MAVPRHGHRTYDPKTGARESPTYTTWRAMMQRCHDPKHQYYENYGAQGIIVVERWHTFDNFLEDMGERPRGKTLGRTSPFSNYGPGECEWQTALQQAATHSHKLHEVTVNGVTRTKRAWASKLKIKYITLLARIRARWGMAAYTTPRGHRGPSAAQRRSQKRRKRRR